jgi:heme/copper-type cytochrome/quinol oxidase subunit 1
MPLSVDCLRHNHSTWMVMRLTVFGWLAKQAFLISKLRKTYTPKELPRSMKILWMISFKILSLPHTNKLNNRPRINHDSNTKLYQWQHKAKISYFLETQTRNSSKLKFYNTFKTEYQLEKYLSTIKNPTERKTQNFDSSEKPQINDWVHGSL